MRKLGQDIVYPFYFYDQFNGAGGAIKMRKYLFEFLAADDAELFSKIWNACALSYQNGRKDTTECIELNYGGRDRVRLSKNLVPSPKVGNRYVNIIMDRGSMFRKSRPKSPGWLKFCRRGSNYYYYYYYYHYNRRSTFVILCSNLIRHRWRTFS